jgi:hypothetical protein
VSTVLRLAQNQEFVFMIEGLCLALGPCDHWGHLKDIADERTSLCSAVAEDL